MASTNDADDKLQHATLLNGLKRAFTSEEHSDLTIICQDRQWKAHKFLLCAQSEWFRKACAGPWKEGKEGTITLKEDDPQVIEAMLHWFYEYDYVTPQDQERPLVLDLEVYIAAEKYLLPNLKRLAATKFEQRAEKDWKSNRFVGAIFGAYNCLPESDRVLKQKIARIVSKHRIDLFHPVKGSETFKVLAVKVPEFGRDVLIASNDTGDNGELEKYRCPTCKKCLYIEKETEHFVCPKGCTGPRTMKRWADYKER
ncbi:hypothetical protein D0869_05298 [Hortaea werneckii]|uniref:BTB domain-containing protein n=1 Tax=Hortaea werneckii TaxID=91943 RepID=A0A3M6WZ39_HORWE|nr:hypothetical protein KC324_g2984 [Hortaea werneckii]KAI7594239.1 hypothetical protein KC316_g1246 [Hortaea werneckii]RMX83446.1 hypothetical protein D0869_05298 [Hortaea werneckii]RMY04006.1 hypothetical protein D0868_07170 [Hortaea werneckii]